MLFLEPDPRVPLSMDPQRSSLLRITTTEINKQRVKQKLSNAKTDNGCKFNIGPVKQIFGANNCDYFLLSHDVPSGSDITPCIKIDKPLVVHTFSNIT